MEVNKAKSCLRTFLEVSKIQIDEKDRIIKKKSALKAFYDSSKKTEVNGEISALVDEKAKIQGQLDSVRLEILDMILENPSLISAKLLAKKGCSSVSEFVEGEKSSIELRGLYSQYPCSIADVLNVGLSASKDDFSLSLFDKPQTEATVNDVKSSVDEKNVKVMIKSM